MKAEPQADLDTEPVLTVKDLQVGFAMPDRTIKPVVAGLDLELQPDRALALVGESGSGKSVSMRAVLGLLPSNARVSGQAQLRVDGATIDLLASSESTLRRHRGRTFGMVFQNAMDALNPSIPLAEQLTEHLRWHGICNRAEAHRRAVVALGDVGIPQPERRIKMYPFQLSGGMRQRAMIAMATITRPRIVIADEPTTALDVTVQKQVLDLLRSLRDQGMALIMITHDLGVARYLCDDAVVLQDGQVRERATVIRLLDSPQDPYTRSLVDSALDLIEVEPSLGELPEGEAPQAQTPAAQLASAPTAGLTEAEESTPLLEVRELTKTFGSRGGSVTAVDHVSFDLAKGGSLGVVGESGSGKSTLARLVMRLIEPSAGRIQLNGEDLLALPPKQLRLRRRGMQMVFQSPYGSLLPTYTAAANIAEPLRINGIGDKAERRDRAISLLGMVRLGPQYADVYPRQLSGGQQQRVAIARALALNPGLLVADEPTSALDASVQASVLALLADLQAELGFSLLLITHNLAVVQRLTNHLLVMRSGQVVESGSTEQIFADPEHPYTKTLLDAVLPVHLPTTGPLIP